MKRFSFIPFAIYMMISIMFSGILSTSASVISTSQDYYVYKEHYIKNYCSYKGLVSEIKMPYRAYVETLDENIAFQVALDAWKVATISPDSLITEITQSNQFKYYEAILIDLLVRDTQDESFIKNIQSQKDTLLVSAWKKYVDYSSDALKNIPITSENAVIILEEMKSIGKFSKALKYADIIGDCIDYATDISDLLDKLTKIEMIEQMSDNYAEILGNMSNKCGSNIYLQSAINDVKLIFSNDLTTEQIKAFFTTKTTVDIIYKEYMKQVKQSIISNLGMVGIAIDISQSAGVAVANAWFNTEDMINDYYQLCALYEIEDLIVTEVLNTSGSTFCTAFKLYENTCLMGCEYSKKFVEPIYTSAFCKLFGWSKKHNYDSYITQLDKLKEDVAFAFEMIDVGADSWYIIDTKSTNIMNRFNPTFESKLYEKNDYYDMQYDIQANTFSTNGDNLGTSIILKEDLVIYNDFKITGGTINCNGYTLTIYGNLIMQEGTINVNGGKLIVIGDMTQEKGHIDANKGKLLIEGDYYQNQDVNLNGGELTVTGNFFQNANFNINKGHVTVNKTLQQTKYVMNIGNGTLDIMEDYLIVNGSKENPEKCDGILRMNGSYDRLNINGDFCTYGGWSKYDHITNGIMRIKGNFTQISDSNTSPSFRANDNHKVVFCGDSKQTISFNCLNAKFANVEFENSNIEFIGTMYGWKLKQNVTLNGDVELPLEGALDLNGYDLTINGNLTLNKDHNIESSMINVNGGRLIVNGDLVQNNSDNDIDINNGLVSVAQNYKQTNGNMCINGGTLDIKGDYMYDDGALKMVTSSDKVFINKNFTIKSKYDSLYNKSLRAGTIILSGDFKQNVYSRNFSCTGSHKVILNGSDVQEVCFGVKSIDNGFNILELTKDKNTGYIFAPDNCWNELILASGNDYTDEEDTNIVETLPTTIPTILNTSTPEIIETITVYFKNSENWGNIYYYVWGGTTNMEWPGSSCKKLYGNIWSAAIPSDSKYIIFNDAKNQTADISLSGGNKIAYLDGNNDINDLGDSWPSATWYDIHSKGDADCNNALNIKDVTLVQMFVAGYRTMADENTMCADVNNDGSVTITDVTLIHMFVTKVIKSF